MTSHPVHSLNISADIIDCLLEEFDSIINSKRLRSRINKIVEVIDILWKRNIFYIDQNVSNTIFKYVSTAEKRDIIQNYINTLTQNGNVDGSVNVYGKIRQEYLNRRTQEATSPSTTIPSITSYVQQNVNSSRNSNQNANEARRRHQIFRVVCDNIDNWRDLGRCFDMKDAELNHIGQELRDDVKLMTNRILEQMEERHGDQFYEKLCEALVDTRRKDILRNLRKL